MKGALTKRNGPASGCKNPGVLALRRGGEVWKKGLTRQGLEPHPITIVLGDPAPLRLRRLRFKEHPKIRVRIPARVPLDGGCKWNYASQFLQFLQAADFSNTSAVPRASR